MRIVRYRQRPAQRHAAVAAGVAEHRIEPDLAIGARYVVGRAAKVPNVHIGLAFSVLRQPFDHSPSIDVLEQ